MSLEDLKAKMDAEHEAERTDLLSHKKTLQKAARFLKMEFDEILEEVEERKANWEKEVCDTWGEDEEIESADMWKYDDYLEAEIHRIEAPLWDLQNEIADHLDAIDRLTDRLNQLDDIFAMQWEKAKTEYEEVAVLRWLS